VDSGFRMPSPGHENGFAGAANHFVAIGGMKQVHAIATGGGAMKDWAAGQTS
jgi:hypothetical protein